MKNYTSEVPIERTITRIEQALAKSGARNIIKDYNDGELTALSFTLVFQQTGKMVPVRLPVNTEAVEKVLLSKVRRPHRETFIRIHRQASRTAWKLMQDWIEVQVSLIELQQVEALQVFLPYVWDGRRTFYATLRDGGFKMLTQGKPVEDA